jgi:hypothetical protein
MLRFMVPKPYLDPSGPDFEIFSVGTLSIES